jgi:hypothetical protein
MAEREANICPRRGGEPLGRGPGRDLAVKLIRKQFSGPDRDGGQ